MLYMQKTTPCGRFTVSIESHTPEASFTVADGAQSLKNLSDVLTGGATVALQTAVRLLEAHASPQAAGAVDPVDGVVTG